MNKTCKHYRLQGAKEVCKHPCAPDDKPCVLGVFDVCLLFETKDRNKLKILIN